MANDAIEVRFNPPDLPRRMQRYPEKMREEMERTANQALAHVQSSVPGYPPARPDSSYVRTGTLGRTLGLGGRAEIYEVQQIGAGFEARLGTRLNYAPPVIGSESQTSFFRARGWWNMRTVVEKARPGVGRLYDALSRRLASWLGGR